MALRAFEFWEDAERERGGGDVLLAVELIPLHFRIGACSLADL